MNSTIKFKHLLIFVFLLAVGYTFSSISDESLWIGKTRLWDDQDSNYLKISRKISRTAGATLFDFNTTHFQWAAGTGLTLVNPLGDSIHGSKFALFKDTTIGETPVYKWWVLKKQYFNDYDSLSLKWYYKNPLVSTLYIDSFWAINKNYKLIEQYIDIDLNDGSGDYVEIASVSLPHYGKWRIMAEYDYEFTPGTDPDTDELDSIYVRLKHLPSGEFPPDTAISVHKLPYSRANYCGLKSRGMLMIDKNVWQTELNFKVHALASSNANDGTGDIARKITYIKITALLIH